MKTPSKSKAECDIIARMEANQSRFGSFPSLLVSAENERRLQLNDRPESEREILRCAPPLDAQAEHEKDLEYESRIDYASWETDQPERQEDQ